VIRRSGACLLVILSVAFVVGGCSGTSPQEKAKAKALRACDQWVSAGIGVPTVSAADRKAHLAAALSLSESAAQEATSWDALHSSLVQLNTVLSAEAYDAKIVPAGQANFQTTAQQCAAAGQKP